MAAAYDVVYMPGSSMTVQGTYEHVSKLYGDQWNIRKQGKGNGNWLLTQPSNIYVNGVGCRHTVLMHYGRKRLDAALAERVRVDLENGDLTLEDLGIQTA